MPQKPMIDIRDLSVGFSGNDGRARAVLRNIDLQIFACLLYTSDAADE